MEWQWQKDQTFELRLKWSECDDENKGVGVTAATGNNGLGVIVLQRQQRQEVKKSAEKRDWGSREVERSERSVAGLVGMWRKNLIRKKIRNHVAFLFFLFFIKQMLVCESDAGWTCQPDIWTAHMQNLHFCRFADLDAMDTPNWIIDILDYGTRASSTVFVAQIEASIIFVSHRFRWLEFRPFFLVLG